MPNMTTKSNIAFKSSTTISNLCADIDQEPFEEGFSFEGDNLCHSFTLSPQSEYNSLEYRVTSEVKPDDSVSVSVSLAPSPQISVMYPWIDEISGPIPVDFKTETFLQQFEDWNGTITSEPVEGKWELVYGLMAIVEFSYNGFEASDVVKSMRLIPHRKEVIASAYKVIEFVRNENIGYSEVLVEEYTEALQELEKLYAA